MITGADNGALFIGSLISGMVCGAIYDILRILRFSFGSGRVITFVCDIIWSVFCGIVFTVMFGNFSDGKVRLFALAAGAVGIFAYRFTVGRFTLAVTQFVKNIVTKTFRAFIGYLSRATEELNRRLSIKRKIKKDIRLAGKGFGI